MRREKPLPKEKSFKEFSENKSSRPRSKPRTKKRFEIKDSKDSGNRNNSSRRDSRNSFSGSRDSGRATRNPSDRDSRGIRRDGGYKKPTGFAGRSRDSSQRDDRKSFSRDSRRDNNKHDRRSSRGKSFKEDRRDSKKSWDEVPRNMRGVERRNRDSKKVELFDATCKKCGKPCKVPFKPTMSKGVSCSDCFVKNSRDNSGFRSGNHRPSRDTFSGRSRQNYAKTNGGVKELFDAVCMKCKKPCKVPFKPTGKMGVSCSNCFVKNESPGRAKKSFGKGRGSFNKGRR